MRRTLADLCAAGILLSAVGCAGIAADFPGGDLTPYPLEREPRPDEIYHLPTGLMIEPEGFMNMISSADLIYVGENHSNVHAHRVQLEIIRELHRRFPGRIAVGMEMFRTPQQDSLDRWTRGELTEAQFLKESGWFENWHSDFGYYRDIMTFARDNGMDIVALNPPRHLQKELGMAVGRGEELPPDLAAQLPEEGAVDPFQEKMIKAIFRGHGGTGHGFDSFFRIQVLWEEAMATRIADYLDGPKGKDKKMVVLAGTMHVQFGFGVPRKVLRRRPTPYRIVLTPETSIPEDRRDELTMDVDPPEIPLLAGDFAWMVPYEDLEGDRVRLGIVMSLQDGGVFVERVLEGSAAAAAGIEAGDQLISLDGLPVEAMSDVLLVVNSKSPGDGITVIVRREGGTMTLSPRFPEEAVGGRE